MNATTFKLLAAGLAVCASSAAQAMLNDDDALKAAREPLARMTIVEKCQMLGGSGAMTLSAIPRVVIAKER